jgi:hypothetical protein
MTPVMGRRYGLGEVPTAFHYQGEGHARGKIVIDACGGDRRASRPSSEEIQR